MDLYTLNLKNIRYPNQQKFSVGQIIFWGITLVLAVSFFFFVRRLTACWQLTALPGTLPSYCAVNPEGQTGIHDLNIEGLPITDIPSDVEAPQIEMPQWDGGSRINIVS